MNQGGRQSRSAGRPLSCPRDSGAPGQRRELGRDGGFEGLGRRLGSSSTAEERCSLTRGEVARALQHGWVRTPRAALPASQRDEQVGVGRSPRDLGSARGRMVCRHVTVDPGRQLGPATELGACRHITGPRRNAEVKGPRPGPAHPGWAWTAASAMTPPLVEGDSPRTPGSSTLPRGERAALPARGGDLVSGAQESQSPRECRWLARVTGLAGARSAWPGDRLESGAEKSTALSIGPLVGLGQSLASRSEATWTTWKGVVVGVRLDRLPQHPMNRADRKIANAASRRMLKGHRSNYFQARC